MLIKYTNKQHAINLTQYLKILFIDWKSKNEFEGKVPLDIIQYRLKVSQYTDAVETREYKDLEDCVLACLSIYVSNATAK